MGQDYNEELINETELRWFQDKILNWAKGNLRSFPWRQTTDSYSIFIAEFLLQQTDASRVISVYQQLLKKYPTLEMLAGASISELSEILKPLGFHYRAVRLHEAARLIVEDPNSGGRILNNEFWLLRLPGVGRYIARSVCANAFNQPTAVLDTNIIRIFQRFFGLRPRLSRARDDPFLWEAVQQIAPRTDVGLWNLALIDFGAAVCTSKEPRCVECPLQLKCRYSEFLC